MNTPLQTPDAATQALEDIDVSLPGRFRDDDWHDWCLASLFTSLTA